LAPPVHRIKQNTREHAMTAKWGRTPAGACRGRPPASKRCVRAARFRDSVAAARVRRGAHRARVHRRWHALVGDHQPESTRAGPPLAAASEPPEPAEAAEVRRLASGPGRALAARSAVLRLSRGARRLASRIAEQVAAETAETAEATRSCRGAAVGRAAAADLTRRAVGPGRALVGHSAAALTDGHARRGKSHQHGAARLALRAVHGPCVCAAASAASAGEAAEGGEEPTSRVDHRERARAARGGRGRASRVGGRRRAAGAAAIVRSLVGRRASAPRAKDDAERQQTPDSHITHRDEDSLDTPMNQLQAVVPAGK